MVDENNRVRVYEGLILFDSREASSRWDAFKGQILDILKKHGAEVLRERKWSDRKLAYDIRKVRRGTYLLVHFTATPESIVALRADFKLAEPILRELLIKLDETKESFVKKEDALAKLEAPVGDQPAGKKAEEQPATAEKKEASLAGEAKA